MFQGKKGSFLSAFVFIDKIAEVRPKESLTAYYTLKGNEEFLKDHFKDFPVMPGVLLLETMKQAASLLLMESENFEGSFYRLSSVEEIKFGQFVKPGSVLKIAVRLLRKEGTSNFFEGRIDLVEKEMLPKAKALMAHFTLVPVACTTQEKTVSNQKARLVYERMLKADGF